MKTRILYIHHGTDIGGAPISLLNLVKNLDKDKFEAKIACLKDGRHVQLFRDGGINTEIIGATTHNFCHNETGKKQWYYLPYYLFIALSWFYVAYYKAPKYLKTQKYDLLHLNSHVLTSWAFAGHKLGGKVVLHNREAISRGYTGLRYRILKALIVKNCDHVINISKDNQNRLGITENSSVVYNFIDIPIDYRKVMTPISDKRKILFLGGTSFIKGFSTIADSLPFWNDNIDLILAGNSENPTSNKVIRMLKMIFTDYSKIAEKFQKISVAKNVSIVGILPNPYKAIDECDILLTPFSKPHFSRPAIEAFAYGKPVIATSLVGMDEIIDNNINGLLIENQNPINLANAINVLCKNPVNAQKLGENGRKKAIANFSPPANMKKIHSIYQRVLNR